MKKQLFLKLAIEMKNITHSKVSEDLGIARSTLFRIYDGKSQPQYSTIKALSEYLNVPVEILMTPTEEALKETFRKYLNSEPFGGEK